MPREKLHFLLRHDPAYSTLCYCCKPGEWPEPPGDEEYDEENNPKPPDYTHRARLTATGKRWRLYLLKMTEGEREAKRWFLCERDSQESASRYVERHRRRIRQLCPAGSNSVLWVLAVKEMGYVPHWPV